MRDDCVAPLAEAATSILHSQPMAAIIRVLGLALAVHAARGDTCDGTCDARTINGSAACGLELLPWDGSFGATVATPMRDVIDAPCLHFEHTVTVHVWAPGAGFPASLQ